MSADVPGTGVFDGTPFELNVPCERTTLLLAADEPLAAVVRPGRFAIVGKTVGGDRFAAVPEGCASGVHAMPPGPITSGTKLECTSNVEVVNVVTKVASAEYVVGMNVSLYVWELMVV